MKKLRGGGGGGTLACLSKQWQGYTELMAWLISPPPPPSLYKRAVYLIVNDGHIKVAKLLQSIG